MSSVLGSNSRSIHVLEPGQRKVTLNTKSTMKMNNKGTKFQELLFLDASV